VPRRLRRHNRKPLIYLRFAEFDRSAAADVDSTYNARGVFTGVVLHSKYNAGISKSSVNPRIAGGMMRRSRFLLAVAVLATCAPASLGQVPAGTNTLKSNTTLITVDVVATDSHGDVVRGLTQDNLQVYGDHGAPQSIVHFQFVDARARRAPSSSPPPALSGVFSNQSQSSTQMAPTVILLDALNTNTLHRMQIRRDMILFLQKLPQDTPVAVFLLGHTIHVIQSFTTDPAILRAAVEQVSGSTPIESEKYPQYDANSPSNMVLQSDPETPASVMQGLEDFEKANYLSMVQQRVEETAEGMRVIAKYLSGYPGRKNVIWFSEAFPIWIEPNSDFGSDPFLGSASFDSKVQAAAASLMDAGVAVYPVDARGLEPNQAYSADKSFADIQGNMAGAINQEDQLRLNSQATLEQMADQTGGRTCINTNDLAGCVLRALNEDSSYYELSYYPTGIKWDNQFHKISIKTNVRGVQLDYRRGFIATDSGVLMKHEKPTELLKDVCRDPLPSTKIGMTVTALPPNGSGPSAEMRYLLTIAPNALTFEPDAQSLRIDAQMAICEFDPSGAKFAFYPKDLSRAVPEATFQSWKLNGIRNVFDYSAKPENRRLRFAVVDLPSGETGSVDVPAHPTEFGSLTTRTMATPGAGAPVSGVAPAAVSPAQRPAPATNVIFRLPSGKSGGLDWAGDKLVYQGDVGIALSAPAFFHSLYGGKFQCEAGNLVPDAPNGPPPSFLFNFRNPSGLIALVDLGGSYPVYSGNLPVDEGAKAFFDRLWKMCHCEAP
jgi:VWFA-related protein